MLEYVNFHRIKNLIIFLLGNISGFIIFFFVLRFRVLDFVREDLGGKLQGLQFFPENSKEPITIINSQEKLYIPMLIYLSLTKGFRRKHRVIWYSKALNYIYTTLFLLLGIVIALAIQYILEIQV